MCRSVAVCSDCFPLLPAAQIRAGTRIARSTSLRQTNSTAVSHQTAGFSIIHHNIVNLARQHHLYRRHPAHQRSSCVGSRCISWTSQVAFVASRSLYRSRSSRRLRGIVHGTSTAGRVGFVAISSRRSFSEFAECACTRTTSGFLKCVVARSATTLILLARTACVDESHTPSL